MFSKYSHLKPISFGMQHWKNSKVKFKAEIYIRLLILLLVVCEIKDCIKIMCQSEIYFISGIKEVFTWNGCIVLTILIISFPVYSFITRVK